MESRFIRSLKRRLGLNKPDAFNPLAPFGSKIKASRLTYLDLHKQACARNYPAIDAFVGRYKHNVDTNWLNELALHTQVVIKQSELNFQHGKVLYAVLRDFIDRNPEINQFTVLETGTSRGYSIICLSYAFTMAQRDGKLVTVDVIGHNHEHLWNCIDDHEGPKTRHELLSPWATERDRVVFLGGDSRYLLSSLGMGRIHFSFLDGGHTEEDVLLEYAYVEQRQQVGDMIVFDDVTPGVFDGIVQAVEKIKAKGLYAVETLQAEERRAYAIATRIR